MVHRLLGRGMLPLPFPYTSFIQQPTFQLPTALQHTFISLPAAKTKPATELYIQDSLTLTTDIKAEAKGAFTLG